MEVIKISGKQLRTRRTRSQDGSRQTVLVSEPHGSQCLISFRNMCQCSRTNGNRVDGCYGLLINYMYIVAALYCPNFYFKNLRINLKKCV